VNGIGNCTGIVRVVAQNFFGYQASDSDEHPPVRG
jgi:hypothetical protein